MWCQYITSYAGLCGLREVKDGRCERHKGLKNKPKTEKSERFRGDSSYQRNQGMFNNKGE